MTLIAGYIYKGKAHIIADSAETIEVQGIRETRFSESISSPFLNPPYVSVAEEKLVIEAANKIFVIKDQIIIAFSGLVKEGKDIVNQIRYLLDKPRREPISITIHSFLVAENPTNTEYIIGGMEDNKPFLSWYVNNQAHCIARRDADVAVAGIIDFHQLIIKTIVVSFDNDFSSEESLILILANLQAESLHSQSFKKGVGGFFNGVSISDEGIEWAKDTINYLYSTHSLRGEKAFIAYHVYKYNRDNCVFLSSGQFRGIFYTEESAETRKAIFLKWKDDVNEKAWNGTADYYVMISYDTRTVVVMSNKEGKKDRIKTSVAGGNISFSFPPNIRDEMCQYFKEEDIPSGIRYYVYTNFLP